MKIGHPADHNAAAIATGGNAAAGTPAAPVAAPVRPAAADASKLNMRRKHVIMFAKLVENNDVAIFFEAGADCFQQGTDLFIVGNVVQNVKYRDDGKFPG